MHIWKMKVAKLQVVAYDKITLFTGAMATAVSRKVRLCVNSICLWHHIRRAFLQAAKECGMARLWTNRKCSSDRGDD